MTLLERGREVEHRGRDIGALMVRRILNPESNLCYGEGGAGTWSDGKLTTKLGRNGVAVRAVRPPLPPTGIVPSGATPSLRWPDCLPVCWPVCRPVCWPVPARYMISIIPNRFSGWMLTTGGPCISEAIYEMSTSSQSSAECARPMTCRPAQSTESCQGVATSCAWH